VQKRPPPLASLAPMGILDDAIREHLELKRSHGASEDEVRRQEVEVFGAARADVAAQPAAEAQADEHTQLLTPEREHPAGEADEPRPDDGDAVHPGDHAIPDTHDHLHPGGSDPAYREDTELLSEGHEEHGPPVAEAGGGLLEPSQVEPGPPVSPEQLHHHHHDEQHPALADHDHIGREEHAPEPVFGHAPESPIAPTQGEEGGSEDVLEETPEFLQDAPEHDRLWFEQKPPRDFDFDE
jgi:hypothetical protein